MQATMSISSSSSTRCCQGLSPEGVGHVVQFDGLVATRQTDGLVATRQTQKTPTNQGFMSATF